MNQPAPLLTFPIRQAWRAWLESHHASATVAWLVYFKEHAGKPSIPYEDSVEEALRFGWIDGIIRRLDDERYARRFGPRISGSRWSALNKRRAEKMIREGIMAPAGMVKFRVSGKPQGITSRIKTPDPHPEFVKALRADAKAWKYFNDLAPFYQR